jgi:hypothetical protein
MTVATDFAFPRSYECEIVDELPGGELSRHFYYPGADLTGGGDGVLIRIAAEETGRWFGTFAFGKVAQSTQTTVLSMPDPYKLCVVARGSGYIVSVRDPRQWENVKAVPIIDVRALPRAGLVVFANLTELVAYDAVGLRWRTGRLSWDGMKLTTVTDEKIVGEYWDLRSDQPQTFEVDVATGYCRGGVE